MSDEQRTSWVPNPDDMDRCLNCRLPWDQHAANNPSWCPRVIEALTSNRELIDRVCRGVASIQEGEQLRVYIAQLEYDLEMAYGPSGRPDLSSIPRHLVTRGMLWAEVERLSGTSAPETKPEVKHLRDALVTVRKYLEGTSMATWIDGFFNGKPPKYSAEDYERVIATGGNGWSTLERLREMAMENHGFPEKAGPDDNSASQHTAEGGK